MTLPESQTLNCLQADVFRMDDAVFLTASELSVITPQATESEVSQLFGGHNNDDGPSYAQSIELRSLLYFGD